MNTHQWYLNGLSGKKPFVSTWDTTKTSSGSSGSTQVKLPIYNGGTYSFSVNWGDSSSSTITAWNDAAVTHTYSSAGTYTITITGICTGWNFNNTGDRLKLLSIASWGSLKLGNLGGYFYGCSNLNLALVSDVLNLTGMTNLNEMFNSCTSITTINRIGEWDLSAITSIGAMFVSTTNFNQDLGGWNVSNISEFSDVFNGSRFNNGNSSSINNWVLKQTGTVNLTRMFALNSYFNQPLNNWNTIAVTDIHQMFQNATAFNQPLNNWNVSAVTNMTNMFYQAPAFNQNLGSWNVSAVINFDAFMYGKTAANFSTTNLDAIYNGWSTRPVLSGKTISFGSAKYTSASSAGRAILTGAPNNWTITDGGI